MAVQVWDGEALEDVALSLWTGSREVDLAYLGAMPGGYGSVDGMLATNDFNIAHRGGSVDWAEMSLRAYTESVARRVGALEVSLARTSDGVWFGHHDQYLDRVVLGTAGTTMLPSAYTWAQIQEMSILPPSGSTYSAQPFMRWEQFVEAYGQGSHVVFADPKYALSSAALMNEFWGMLESMPGDPQSYVVAKYYGTAVTLAEPALDRGFKTWGYFYESDYTSGVLATQMAATYNGQPRWSLLGMDYGASPGAWTAITGGTQPVLGHICPNAAAKTTAIGRGAVGCMVSGIRPVVSQERDLVA